MEISLTPVIEYNLCSGKATRELAVVPEPESKTYTRKDTIAINQRDLAEAQKGQKI